MQCSWRTRAVQGVVVVAGVLASQPVDATPLSARMRVETGGARAGVRVEDVASGMHAAVELQGLVRTSGSSRRDGSTRYPDALGPGTALIRKVDANRVEDLLLLEHDDGRTMVAYRVDVSSAAGLRLVGDTLELLDAGGAPRLRATAPFAEDARGTRYPLHLDVSGCAVDRSPAAPWGRPVTPPGAASCLMVVSWAGASATYPLLVDPIWTATPDLPFPRDKHIAVGLDDGRVLVATGEAPIDGLQPADLYDPPSNTWAVSGKPLEYRESARAVLLDDGKVLIAGGMNDSAACELYDPATGVFTATGSMSTPRRWFGLAKLKDGRVLAAGGYGTGIGNSYELSSAEIYDPSAGTWSNTGSLSHARSDVTAVALQDGRVLVPGGVVLGTRFSSAEVFDPQLGTWSSAGDMSVGRAMYDAALLTSGRVAVTGGDSTSNLDVYNPATNSWKLVGSVQGSSEYITATALPDDSLLIAGLDSGGTATGTVVFAATTEQMSFGGDMNHGRGHHTATLLAPGATSASVLVVGGMDSPTTAEVRTANLRGATCTKAEDCFTGACVGGVCCDSSCQGACMACSAAQKGQGPDGECGLVAAGTDPFNDCSDQGPGSCGTSGACDGNGACAVYPAGTPCAAPTCADATASTFACDSAGACTQKNDDCGHFTCGTSQCLSSCTVDTDCRYGGMICDTASGQCVDAPTPDTPPAHAAPVKDSGCSCATPRRRGSRSGAWLALALAAVALRRRRFRAGQT